MNTKVKTPPGHNRRGNETESNKLWSTRSILPHRDKECKENDLYALLSARIAELEAKQARIDARLATLEAAQ